MVVRREALIGGLSAFILVGMLAVGLSGADARSFASSTSFGFYKGVPGSSYPSSFHGQVSSDANQCRKKRLVKIFRKKPRRNVLIGRTKASRTGQWTIEKRRVPTARYFALLPRKKFGPRGRHVCRAYRTSVLRFGDS